MSDAPDVERELRELLRSRVGTLPPPIETYQTVQRRYRQSRRRAVSRLAAAAVVATLAIGVPLALRPSAGDATRPAPAAGGTRGSLAGDTALIAAARQYALKNVFRGANSVDLPTVRVPFAEQRDGYVVVLVVGYRAKGNWQVSTFVGRRPGESALEVVFGGKSGHPNPGQDDRFGQQFRDPYHVLGIVYFGQRRDSAAPGQNFGVAVFPPGYRAEITHGSAVGADCGPQHISTPTRLPLTDGTALFSVDGDSYGPTVRIMTNQGIPVGYPTMLQVRQKVVNLPGPVTLAEFSALLEGRFRGDVTDQEIRHSAAFVLSWPFSYDIASRESATGFLGVWAGHLPGNTPGLAMLIGARLRSGATILSGVYNTPSGQRDWTVGCVPAGQLERTVVTGRLTELPGKPVVVVAPAAATRAEAVFSDAAVVPVPLTGGGGFLVRAGTLVKVRAYDRNGRLLGEGTPGNGLPRYR